MYLFHDKFSVQWEYVWPNPGHVFDSIAFCPRGHPIQQLCYIPFFILIPPCGHRSQHLPTESHPPSPTYRKAEMLCQLVARSSGQNNPTLFFLLPQINAPPLSLTSETLNVYFMLFSPLRPSTLSESCSTPYTRIYSHTNKKLICLCKVYSRCWS
mgnify:CR=1 FL=1